MASGKVPEKDVTAVANAFIQMSKDPKGREILHQASKEVGLANDAYFIAASDADYASYRRFFQNAPSSLH
jgi:phosphonate transport system substrate-binding protein